MSILVFRLAILFFTRSNIEITVKIPNGILTKKIPLHPKQLIISPPIKEPVPVATEIIAVQIPNIRALLVESGYEMNKSANELGINKEAPKP